MARARNIKPGLMLNEKLADCDYSTRLLFIYTWMLSDRRGRLEDRPRRIKAQSMPYDDVDVDSMLSTLDQLGFILRYEVDGCKYIQVKNFEKHQSPHKNEQDSNIPAPPDYGANDGQTPDDQHAGNVHVSDEHHTCTVHTPDIHRCTRPDSHDSHDSHDCLNTYVTSAGADSDMSAPTRTDGKSKKGKKQKGPEYTDEFEQAWSEYPKRGGQNNKARAFRAWQARLREGFAVDDLLDGVRRYKAYMESTGRIGTEYVKHTSTFFGPDNHFADDFQSETSEINVDEFLADCKERGLDPVPTDDEVFDYAEEAGIPNQFIELCWVEFVQRNRESGKRYSDWRSAFRRCVRDRWYSLWYFDSNNEPCLTADGKQAANKHNNNQVKSHAA